MYTIIFSNGFRLDYWLSYLLNKYTLEYMSISV